MNRSRLLLPLAVMLVAACSAIRTANTPAEPVSEALPEAGSVEDAKLGKTLKDAGLVVDGTVIETVSGKGSISANFSFGDKETWYHARVKVHETYKGNIKRAKQFHTNAPAALMWPPFDEELEEDEIIVQFPATTGDTKWSGAPDLVEGERAIMAFKMCHNCIITEVIRHPTGMGYPSSPWVIMDRTGKLPVSELSRVQRLLDTSE